MFKDLPHKPLATLMAMFLLVLASGCKERIPASNTDAYFKLHGIVNDGKTANEITLIGNQNGNQWKLRFPPNVPITVLTHGSHNPQPTPIKKGYANDVSLTIDLTKQLGLTPDTNESSNNFVNIHFKGNAEPPNAAWHERIRKQIESEAVSVTDKPDWGLREYATSAPNSENITRYYYIPINQSFQTIDGLPMRFWCRSGGRKADNNQSQRCVAVAFDTRTG